MMKIPSIRATFPGDSLRPLADWLHALAEEAREAADLHDATLEMRERVKVDMDRRFKARAAAVQELASHLAAGTPPEAAVQAIAQLSELEPEIIRKGLAEARRELKSQERRRKVRHILRLYGQGKTDSEIAAKVGMHPKSVNRIISNERRAADHGTR